MNTSYNNSDLINMKLFNIYVENKTYIIKIGETFDKMNLVIESKDSLSNFIYKIKLNYDDFQKLSKSFKICDTLDDINETLSEIFNSGKVSITYITPNVIHLSLKIFLIAGKEHEIKLELKRDNYYDNNNYIQILYNKIQYLENKMMKLEEIIKIQNEQIRDLNNWKNQYSDEIEKIQIIKNNELILNRINTKILKNKNELDFIENRLYNNDKLLLQKNIIYKLLYRGSENGFSAQSFHNKCDYISGTLTIVKTTKGMRFGGYTELMFGPCSSSSWESHYDNAGICFGFSLDLFKIYNYYDYHKINPKNCLPSIFTHYSLGPKFNCFFGIDSFTNNKAEGSVGYQTSNNHFGKFEKDYEINNGIYNFSVQELEIFQILFD